MGFMDSMKNFFIPEDEEDTPTPVATTSAKASTDESPRKAAPEPPRKSPEPSSYSSSTSGYSRSSYSTNNNREDRYTTIKATGQFQVVLVKATTYATDSKKVADYLMQNKTVVLNLEEISEEEKRRIVDFVVGAAYALHGRIRPIATETFLIIPQNVGFDGDSIVGELKDNGLVN